jgi:hypothetical protein
MTKLVRMVGGVRVENDWWCISRLVDGLFRMNLAGACIYSKVNENPNFRSLDNIRFLIVY